MKATLLLVALAAAASPVSAQSTITMPAGYETKAGDYTTYIMGGYANARMQFADGTNLGTARVATKVDYRPDPSRSYSASIGMGRKWTKVTLDLGETSLEEMYTVWASNHRRTPTRVYDKVTNWLTISGRPTVGSWGVVGFAFSKPWVYSGKRDLLFDFDFQGGTLKNGNTGWRNNAASLYYMDGLFNDTVMFGAGAYYPSSGTCRDSSTTTTTRAYSYGYAAVFADKLVPSGFESVLQVYHTTYGTAPNAPVVQLLSYAGGSTGVDIGAKCNRLYLNLSTVLQVTRRVADSNGYSSAAILDGLYYLPSYAPWFGATLWTQGAWTDSKTKAFSLTAARSFTIPTRRPSPIRKRAAIGYTRHPTLANYWTMRNLFQTLPRLTLK